MERSWTGVQFLALAAAVLLSACTSWYWPESRSRGHLFDEFAREGAWLDGGHAREQFEAFLRRNFPPGTSLADVMPRIEGADVTCLEVIEDQSTGSRRATTCNYKSRSYIVMQVSRFGGAFLCIADIDWTLRIVHENGRVEDYAVTGSEVMLDFEPEEFRDGVYRQRELERQQQTESEG